MICFNSNTFLLQKVSLFRQDSIFPCRPQFFVFARCNMFVWPWGKCPGWKELGPIKSKLSALELNDLDTAVFLKGSVSRICIKAISRSIVYQWQNHKPLRAKPLIKPTLPFLEMPVISLSTKQAVIQEVKEQLHYASPELRIPDSVNEEKKESILAGWTPNKEEVINLSI